MFDKLVARQDKIMHRRQLLECGLSPDALRWKVRSGRWQRPLPGIYALFSGTLTRRQQMIAGYLFAGPQSCIAGLTALELFNLRYVRKDPRIHILIPHSSRVTASGFVSITRTRRMDDRVRSVGVLVFSSPARAVADAARASRSRHDVLAMVAEVVQRRLVTVDSLRSELMAGPRRGSAHLRAAIAQIAGGVQSAPEAELRQLMRTSRILPEALWNPVLTDSNGRRLPTPDGYLPSAAVALEVDSRAHHMSPDDWERTMRRHNLLATHGVAVLHFSPARIRDEPHSVLAEIERAYLDRGNIGGRVTLSAHSRSIQPPGVAS